MGRIWCQWTIRFWLLSNTTKVLPFSRGKKAPSCFLLSSFSFSIRSRLLVKGFGVNQSSWRLLKSILEANGWQLLQFVAKTTKNDPFWPPFWEAWTWLCATGGRLWAGVPAIQIQNSNKESSASVRAKRSTGLQIQSSPTNSTTLLELLYQSFLHAISELFLWLLPVTYFHLDS